MPDVTEFQQEIPHCPSPLQSNIPDRRRASADAGITSAASPARESSLSFSTSELCSPSQKSGRRCSGAARSMRYRVAAARTRTRIRRCLRPRRAGQAWKCCRMWRSQPPLLCKQSLRRLCSEGRPQPLLLRHSILSHRQALLAAAPATPTLSSCSQ